MSCIYYLNKQVQTRLDNLLLKENELYFVPNFPFWPYYKGRSRSQCICKIINNNPIAYLFYFPYISSSFEKSIHIARPVNLKGNENYLLDLINHVISKASKGIEKISIECYSNISDQISFPSTTCVIDLLNNPNIISSLRENGFIEKSKFYTYKIDRELLYEIIDENKIVNSNISLFPYVQANQINIQRFIDTYDLRTKSQRIIKPSDFSNIFDNRLNSFEIYSENKRIGLFQWYPNYYECYKKNPFFYLNENLEKKIIEYDYDKIKVYRLSTLEVCQKFDTTYHIILEIMKKMLSVINFNQLHFGPFKSEIILNIMKEIKAIKCQEIMLLEKIMNI